MYFATFFLLSTTLIIGVYTQEKKDCLSEEVITESIGCITKKFSDLIGEIDLPFPYSATKERVGRHLLSLGDTNSSPHHNIIGSPYESIKKFGEIHSEIFRDLSAGMIYIKENLGDGFDILQHAALLRNMSKFDLGRLKKLYSNQLVHELLEFRGAIEAKARIVMKQERAGRKQNSFNDGCLGGLLDQEICDLLVCLDKYNMTDLEDGLEWVECLFDCGDLPQISTCVQETFTNCKEVTLLGETSWVGSLVVQGFSSFVGLQDKCLLKVSTPELTVSEGEDPGYLEFTTFLPPPIMCYDISKLDSPLGLIIMLVQYITRGTNETWCTPEIQISTSNYLDEVVPYISFPPLIELGRPKCRSGALLGQAVIGWHEHAVNESGRIVITSDNWNSTFRIPLHGAIDSKKDGDQKLSVTVKMVINGEPKHTERIELTVVDKDPGQVSTCRSLNDPHIITFDGHYYNNHFEGYFTLYEHTDEDYKVQAIYQKCSNNTDATCSCGVAVQSGDDVIVIDKCHRVSDDCNDDACSVPTKLKVFLNGELTDGTKILRKRDGMEIDVKFPHGALVQIVETAETLNVFVRPSVQDRGKTKGLCGVFNEDPNDDLLLPNGTVYTGEGSQPKGQPKPFSDAWRVSQEDSIFQGVLESANATNPGSYCRCQYVIIAGVQCECGRSLIVDDCDLEGQDITASISVFATQSLVQLAKINPKQTLPKDDIIMDLSYDPKDPEWNVNGTWSQTTAATACQKRLKSGQDKDAMLKKCSSSDWLDDFNFLNNYETSCIEDFQLTDSDRWMTSAVQGARLHCLDAIDRMLNIYDEDFKEIQDLDCLNNCNDQGNCTEGICRCEAEFAGPDCSGKKSANPRIIGDISNCDTRTRNCSYANIYGQNLFPEYNIECQFIEMQAPISNDDSMDVTNSSTFYITPGHIACKLPSPKGNYRISLSYSKGSIQGFVNDRNLAATKEIMVKQFDSMCYTCDANTGNCVRRNENDHCLIDGRCLATDEADPDDSCQVCIPTVSTSQYQQKQDDVCKKIVENQETESRQRTIRIIVSCSLSGFVVIVALVLFLVKGRGGGKSKESKGKTGHINYTVDMRHEQEGQAPVSQSATTSFTNHSAGEHGFADDQHLPTTVNTAGVNHYDQLYTHIPGPEENSVDVNTKDLAELVRMQQAAMQTNRNRSNSGGSIRSIGLGASGPVSFGKYARSIEELAPPADLPPMPNQMSLKMQTQNAGLPPPPPQALDMPPVYSERF